jgi:hypothetical protein
VDLSKSIDTIFWRSVSEQRIITSTLPLFAWCPELNCLSRKPVRRHIF